MLFLEIATGVLTPGQIGYLEQLSLDNHIHQTRTSIQYKLDRSRAIVCVPEDQIQLIPEAIVLKTMTLAECIAYKDDIDNGYVTPQEPEEQDAQV